MQVTLCDLIQEVARNACESGADTVELEINEIGSEFRFLVRDDGKGMSPSEAESVVKPLGAGPASGETGVSGPEAADAEGSGAAETPGHKVGIGIPFLINTVNEASGVWDFHTEQGRGTSFNICFNMENIETPPQGDIAVSLRTVLLFAGPREIIIKRLRRTGINDVRYEIRKTEITKSLGGLADPASLTLLGTYLKALESAPAGNQ